MILLEQSRILAPIVTLVEMIIKKTKDETLKGRAKKALKVQFGVPCLLFADFLRQQIAMRL